MSELAAAIAEKLTSIGDRLQWATRDNLALLPIEVVRPTGVSSWVVRVPGVERDFVITGDEHGVAEALFPGVGK